MATSPGFHLEVAKDLLTFVDDWVWVRAEKRANTVDGYVLAGLGRVLMEVRAQIEEAEGVATEPPRPDARSQ